MKRSDAYWVIGRLSYLRVDNVRIFEWRGCSTRIIAIGWKLFRQTIPE